MKLVIQNPGNTAALQQALAEFHAGYILRQIRGMPISPEQKLTLLSAVMDRLSGPP